MAIRTIEYTLTPSGITPATEQQGGMQGDHNVTELRFALSAELLSAIYENRVGTVYYRFDGYSGAGTMYSTSVENKELFPESFTDGDEIELAYPLENALTRDGGNIRVYLVIIDISKEEGVATERELYSFPALIRLKGIAGRTAYGVQYKGITGAELSAKAAAERAEKALSGFTDSIDGKYDPESSNAQSGIAVAEAIESKTELKNEEYWLKLNGAYGAGVYNSNDELTPMPFAVYTDENTNPYCAANKLYVDGMTEKNKTITDQTYNPTSANAQSGTAVAEAVSGIPISQAIKIYKLTPCLPSGLYVITSSAIEVETELKHIKYGEIKPFYSTILCEAPNSSDNFSIWYIWVNREPIFKDEGGEISNEEYYYKKFNSHIAILGNGNYIETDLSDLSFVEFTFKYDGTKETPTLTIEDRIYRNRTIKATDNLELIGGSKRLVLSGMYGAGIYDANSYWDLTSLEVYTPDYDMPYAAANKLYVDTLVGSIETALDSIIAIQETLIGGESV